MPRRKAPKRPAAEQPKTLRESMERLLQKIDEERKERDGKAEKIDNR